MGKKMYTKVREAIKNCNADPVNSFGVFLPVAISLAAFISCIISYIVFVINGGYTEQINEVKTFGLFAGYKEKFTMGTAETMLPEGVGIVISFFVGVEFILMMINYFRNNGKTKRILMIVDIFFLTISIVLTIAIFLISIGKLLASDEAAYKVFVIFEKYQLNPMIILILYAVCTLASILGFIALVMTTNECSWMIKDTVISLFFSYLILPLLLLVLENMIPLMTGAMAVVIIILIIVIVIVILLFMFSMAGGSEESGSGSSNSSSSESYASQKPVQKAPYQEVKKYDLNTIFWRDKGGYGIAVPQADCIYCKDSWGDKKYVCTVYDFEKGKVAIINKGSRVMNVAGCKMPER